MAEGENAKSHPTVTGDDPTEERIFDFFGLPRELRNEIYSMLTEDVGLQKGYDDDDDDDDEYDEHAGLRITVQSKMLLTPRLLNHQLKNEYEQEMKDHETLVIKDIGGPWLQKMQTVRVMAGVRSAIIYLLILCSPKTSSNPPCNCMDDLEEQVAWINGQSKLLRSLQPLKVEIHPCSQRETEWNDHGRGAIEDFESMLEFVGDLQIEVFPLSRHMSGYLGRAPEDEAAPVSKWTRAGGWQDL